MRRYGQLIGLKPEHYEEYVKAHADAWPGVLAKISECNIRNYSIFHRKGLLFAYFEYVGDDFDADMAEDGRRPRDPALVGLDEAHAGTPRRPRRGRVVERHGGGIPYGLTRDQRNGS